MQKLILPIDNAKVTAGYMSAKYRKTFGVEHYGIDYISLDADRRILSPGRGIVVLAGQDGPTVADRCGLCLVIIFPDVMDVDGGATRGVACRMFHLSDIAVSAGEFVQQGQLLGHYGKTGAMVTGEHLHLEFDYDIAFPQYSYGVSSAGFIIKPGSVQSSIPPHKVLHLAEGQKLSADKKSISGGWLSEDELKLVSTFRTEQKLDLNDAEHRSQLKKLMEIATSLCKKYGISA